MDCCDLFKYRKALFVSTASAGCYVFFNIFAMVRTTPYGVLLSFAVCAKLCARDC